MVVYPLRRAIKRQGEVGAFRRWAWRSCLAGVASVILLLPGGCQTDSSTPGSSANAPKQLEPAQYDLGQPDTLPANLRVPLEQRDPYLLLPSTINGRRAGWFLLDTGSALNAIGVGLANRLDLPARTGGTAIGIAGRETFDYRTVEQWQINRIALPAKKLAGLELGRLNEAAPFNINGVVGYPVFSERPFTLDIANQTLILHHPDQFIPPEGARRVTLHHHGRLPLVPATLNNGQTVWLIIDSGSDGMITLPQSALQRWPEITAVPQTGSAQSLGVGGRTESTRTWIEALGLFDLTLRNVPAAFEPMGQSMRYRGEPVGRMGLQLLRHFRLTFDAPNDTLWVQWRPERSSEAAN
jgi:hypothetical protein